MYSDELILPSKLSPDNFINDIDITHKEILESLDNLTPKKSNTPDGIPPFVLKKIGPTIVHFLFLLFNLSLSSGQIPRQWKTATIIPVFKKGSKNLTKNYRPISLTSSLCRLFERILSKNILQHLLKLDLLSPNQHGFVPGRSTAPQLLDTLNEWIHSYISNKTTNIVYTDLSKAFDKVCHTKLLQVITSYGISGKLHNWIANFLKGRTQKVNVKGTLSYSLEMLCGVPQGSVLGPILFLIYIDDVSKACSSKTTIRLFADDAKVYSEENNDLQCSLNNISSFFKQRQLELAKEKCETMIISKRNVTNSFNIGEHTLQEVCSVRDLGIVISNNLKWDKHIYLIRQKAYQRAHHILRSFNTNNICSMFSTTKKYNMK